MATNALSKTMRPALGLLVLACCLAAAVPGGFYLQVERPGASHGNALLLVRADGCHEPAKAKVWGTAEGIVKGERRSVSLTLTSVGEGVYAVAPQWPAGGAWVLALTGTYRGRVSTVLVELAPGGTVTTEPPPVQRLFRRPSNADVEGALQRVAARAGEAIGP